MNPYSSPTRVQLPPKRFEDFWDSKFDSIRHHKWFAKLETRRAKLPLLYRAATEYHGDYTQEQVAHTYGVDPRELRDYIAFKKGISQEWHSDAFRKVFQHVLDESYRDYCMAEGKFSFASQIRIRRFDDNTRAINERWEIDPGFWPSNYVHRNP